MMFDNASTSGKATSKRPMQSVIEGDLNFLLDKEIQKVAFVPKPVLFNGCAVSTHHSSTSKSPLAAYADSHSYDTFQAGASIQSKQGSSISQRSSFDDSMNINEMVNGLNDNIKLSGGSGGGHANNRAERTTEEVSPGKVGDGLFTMTHHALVANNATTNTARQDRNATDEGLSSEEENLIAQSSFEIRNILAHKQQVFMSRFAAVDTTSDSMLSEGHQNIGSANTDEQAPTRRLRIFHDITQRSAGKSNETQKVSAHQGGGLLD